MTQSPIELKGSSFTIAVVYLYNAQPEIIREALIKKITQPPAFLKNAPVVINITHVPQDANWQKLQHAISEAGLHVIGVSGCTHKGLKDAIKDAGLPLLSEGQIIKKTMAPVNLPEQCASVKTRIISTPIRSGQQIYARDCDLIIISSVSAGAEVIADGNIHIYGMMRGRVLAGASGDTSSQIFCTHLAAELVCIAGHYWLSNQIPKKFYGHPARLNFSDNALTIQSLLL
ncbi:septum site-determining protein MinC [Candidatus Profftia tarda]|uniref:Probable septum site-determining protein MinC n=1 Tax=Candidatus Profftia tarda TaxID=1177216 RepID=A0A8E4F0C7_9ENTR|nr:septum site-determining protein MinC [Candidatus Profftia tarda]CAD6511899.1 Probable septum site-determining protein MinC [Candidatus Profftia tarda]